MDATQQFEQIKILLRAGEHQLALSALDQLLTIRPNAAALHWHRATCLEALDQLEEALAAIQRTLTLKANYAPAWLKQAELASYLDEGYPHYARDIANAIAADPGYAKAHAADAMLSYQQNDAATAFQKLATAIALAPRDAELYLTRAGLYESTSLEPESEADAVPQFNGMSYSRRKLELAEADYSAILTQQPKLVRALLKRGQLRHKLGLFDAALVDYDTALEQIPADDQRRDWVIEMRQKSENNGAGERDAIARIMEGAIANLSEKERGQLGAGLATSAVRSAAASMRSGQDLSTALEQFVSDDPNELVAIDIAYKIHAQGNEPEPAFEPADAGSFSKDQQAFARTAGKQMHQLDFITLGDFDPLHLQHMLSRRTLVRIYRSQDGHTCAASFKMKPAWPGWLAFLILKLTGKWRQPAVVEFETAFSDGNFLITNNTGQLNPFGTGPRIDTLAMPVNTGFDVLLAAHQQRLASYLHSNPAAQPMPIDGIDGVFALQSQLNRCKRDYRRSIGYVTDDELRQLLGAHFDRLHATVRAKLELLKATDSND